MTMLTDGDMKMGLPPQSIWRWRQQKRRSLQAFLHFQLTAIYSQISKKAIDIGMSSQYPRKSWVIIAQCETHTNGQLQRCGQNRTGGKLGLCVCVCVCVYVSVHSFSIQHFFLQFAYHGVLACFLLLFALPACCYSICMCQSSMCSPKWWNVQIQKKERKTKRKKEEKEEEEEEEGDDDEDDVWRRWKLSCCAYGAHADNVAKWADRIPPTVSGYIITTTAVIIIIALVVVFMQLRQWTEYK